MKNVSVVIPARYASQRFPGKMIFPVLGIPLIVQVYKNVFHEKFAEVVVLIDSTKVQIVLEKYNIPYIFTSPECSSGTHRISSVVDKLKGEYIINVQGDEPLISTEIVSELAEALISSNEPVATLARIENNIELIKSPNVVKVVLNKKNNAMYFSRSLIPFPREENKNWLAHVGIYGYCKEFLKNYSNLEQSNLEDTEKLEQLTFLYNAFNIHVKVGNYKMHGIDVKEDINIVEELLKKQN